MRHILVLALSLVCLVSSHAWSAPLPIAVSVSVSPTYGFEPRDARVTTRIQPNPAYAALCLRVEGLPRFEDGCRPILFPNRKTYERMLLQLPAGDYAITAYVLSTTGGVLAVSTTIRLRVLSGSGEL